MKPVLVLVNLHAASLLSSDLIAAAFTIMFDPDVERAVNRSGCDTILLAGSRLHDELRVASTEALARGFGLIIIEDAVASDDPIHAASTQIYLKDRGARFITAEEMASLLGEKPREESPTSPDCLDALIAGGQAGGQGSAQRIIHRSPSHSDEKLWAVPVCDAEQVAIASEASKRAWPGWKSLPIEKRVEVLDRLAALLEAESPALASRMAAEIGKPITNGLAEVSRAVALLKAVACHASDELQVRCGDDSIIRHRPVGAIAMITPWNNPLAIPIGKIAPALLFGNTVVWKPAPAGSSVAIKVMQLLEAAGCPAGVVTLVCGDRTTALALMRDSNLDAITISGSLASGYFAQEVASRRRIPLQAELGGNNASIVWADCDIRDAAGQIAAGAFGFAGQRCTANRRAIVDARCYDSFLTELEEATANLVWGDPLDAATQVGPVISLSSRSRIDRALSRARRAACAFFAPHSKTAVYDKLMQEGAYYPPTVICCDIPDHEIVQQETFGPVLVVQKARDWDEAVLLCNGVKHGLVAALFSDDRDLQSRFLEQVRCGVLKLNATTADVGVEQPFGGWKSSGVGPPEHGSSNREFYTRTQSVYIQAAAGDALANR